MRNFYYLHLSPEEKRLYRQLERGMGERTGMIRLQYLPVPEKRLREISLFVTLDNPDFYWTKGSFAMRQDGQDIILRFPSLIPEAKIPSADAAVMTALTALMKDLPVNLETGQEASALVETVCRRLLAWAEYDLSADPMEDRLNQSIWSVLVRRRSVCMGFAKALCLILRLLGLPCVVVLGSVFGDRVNGHSWDMVRIGGRWLHADVTMGFSCFRPLWERAHPGAEPPLAPVPFGMLKGSHEMRNRFVYE